MTRCLAPGCGWPVGAWPPACPAHWYALPANIRAALRRNAPADGAPEGAGYAAARLLAASWFGKPAAPAVDGGEREAPWWTR